ncbi:hypothetical protein TrCOL_g10400 [Triparma columacea]|uniref:Uncharacterized protein n=1 Tax=Triparma columacea TaxID=722753 RepID=A0A9W7GEH7_9STRA|nr:hypothetical protein TrCOL_g10400 [Triparma columacea]
MTSLVEASGYKYKVTCVGGDEYVYSQLNSAIDRIVQTEGDEVTLTSEPDAVVVVEYAGGGDDMDGKIDGDVHIENVKTWSEGRDVSVGDKVGDTIYYVKFSCRSSAIKFAAQGGGEFSSNKDGRKYGTRIMTEYKEGVVRMLKYITEEVEDEDEREEIEDDLKGIFGRFGDGDIWVNYDVSSSSESPPQSSVKPSWVSSTDLDKWGVYCRYPSCRVAWVAARRLDGMVVGGERVKAEVVGEGGEGGGRIYTDIVGVKVREGGGEGEGEEGMERDDMIMDMCKRLAELDRKRKDTGRGKVRMRMGFREVSRGLRANKIVLVLLASNLEKGGAIEGQVGNILEEAGGKGVKVIKRWNARKVGKIVGKAVKVSVVGVENVEGVEGEWKKIKKILNK